MISQPTDILSKLANGGLIYDEYIAFKEIVDSDEYLIVAKIKNLPESFDLNGIRFFLTKFSNEGFYFECNLIITAIFPNQSVSVVSVFYDNLHGVMKSGDKELVGYIGNNLENIKK